MDSKEFKLILNKRTYKFTGNSVDEIAAKVQQFYSQSHSPSPPLTELKAKISNQLKFAPVTTKTKIPRLSEAFHVSLAMFKFANGETVDQKTLDERTAICLTCPKRSKTSYCAGCGGLTKATNFLNEAKRLTKRNLNFDDRLKAEYCGVCGCGLPLLLATKKELLPKDEPDQAKMRPDHCWIK